MKPAQKHIFPIRGLCKPFYAMLFTQAAFLTDEESICTLSVLLPVLADVPAGLHQ